MIVSKTTILLLIFVMLFSIFLSSVNNVIKYDQGTYSPNLTHKPNISLKKVKNFGTENKDLVWFLQISDLHISIFRDPSRISEFQDFCFKTVGAIKPLVVLASGDLTDAREKNYMGSTQLKEEWEHYSNTLRKTNVTEVTTWLDLRGNHDNFNVAGLNSQFNYYRKYSIQGVKHDQSYLHIAKQNNVSVAFLGVDACPQPGLRRPFNFIGVLNSGQQTHIKRLLAEANTKSSHIVWFSHYPSSCVLWITNEKNNKEDLRDVIGGSPNSLVHLVGHLHQMAGAVPQMYALQHPGYLELELGDWQDSRVFRLAAIDHGIFSFVDEQHGTWPLILITNPKHASFTMPGREPLHFMRSSTHIRVLVFSISDIKTVEVRIVGLKDDTWMPCSQADGPLYICKWDPSLVHLGVHYIEASASDVQSRKRTISQPFSLDGSRIHFGIIPRMVLMIDAPFIFQYQFATLLLITTIPLCWLRFNSSVPTGTWRILRAVWMLSKISRLYYPLVLYPVYLAFGPWSIGELIEGHTGIIFAWGIFVNGAFIPGSFTYLYGSFQLACIHVPLIIALANFVDRRVRYQWISNGNNATGQPSQKDRKILLNSSFIVLLSIQMLLAYWFWEAYGIMAFLVGPLRTWPIFLSIVLWYQALTLPMTCTRDILRACYPATPT